MNSLQQLLGLTPDSAGIVYLTDIANHLGGPICQPCRLHEPAYAAYVVYDYLRNSAWWAEAGFGTSGEDIDRQFDQGAFAELVDLFTSPVWRGRKYATVRILGHECSEEDVSVPDSWRETEWHTAAVTNSWRLEWCWANPGTMYRVAFADEGFNYDVWLYASAV